MGQEVPVGHVRIRSERWPPARSGPGPSVTTRPEGAATADLDNTRARGSLYPTVAIAVTVLFSS